MLSVASYNILYGKKLDQILLWLKKKKFSFDIVCFQEFPKEHLEEFLEGIPKHFTHAFAVNFTKGKNAYGELTLINTHKVELKKSCIVELGSAFIERRIRRNSAPRTSLVTLLQHNGKKFVLANTHLACFTTNGRRKKQLEKLFDAIFTTPSFHMLPVLLLGDFNYSSRFRQKKLLEFMEKHAFKNAFQEYTHRLFLIKQQLDYVFYNKCEVGKVILQKKPFSDHHLIQFHASI